MWVWAVQCLYDFVGCGEGLPWRINSARKPAAISEGVRHPAGKLAALLKGYDSLNAFVKGKLVPSDRVSKMNAQPSEAMRT